MGVIEDPTSASEVTGEFKELGDFLNKHPEALSPLGPHVDGLFCTRHKVCDRHQVCSGHQVCRGHQVCKSHPEQVLAG